MPIYEYRCKVCGSDFDQLVRHGTVAACPYCESISLERKMSVAAVAKIGGKAAASGLPRTSRSGGCCGGSCGCH